MSEHEKETEELSQFFASFLILSLAVGFCSYYALILFAGVAETLFLAAGCAIAGIFFGVALSLSQRIRKVAAVVAGGLNILSIF